MVWNIFRPLTDFVGWTDGNSRYTEVDFRRSYNAPIIEIDGEPASVTRCGPLSLSVVYAAIRVLSDTVSGLPFALFDIREDGLRSRTKYEGLTNKQNMRLLRRPNPYVRKLHFMQGTVINLALTGNAFAIIRRDRQGQWIGTIPILPERVSIDRETLANTNGEQLIYAVDLPNRAEKLLVSPENMLHFKLHASNYYWGISPVEHHRRLLNLGEDARDWSGKYMNVGGAPGGLLIFDDFISQEQKADIQAMINNVKRSSYAEVGKIIPIGGKPIYVQTGLSQRDSQFLETREQIDKELARIWGVPLSVMGDDSPDFDKGLRSLMFFGISPYLAAIKDEFNNKLFDENVQEADFIIQHLLYADPQTRAEYFKAAIGGNNSSGWMTQNEVRAIDNLVPKDFEEDANVYDRLTHFAFTNGPQQPGESDAD